MTLPLLLLLREEMGHEVVVVAVSALGGLDYLEDALDGALLLWDFNRLHVQNKFNR